MTNHGLVKNNLTTAQVKQYLQRLHHHEHCQVNIETLTSLHQAHMENIPFENLDIVLGRKIQLSVKALFDKVVIGKRGGFCYEVNALFASLLAALGFEVYLHAAGVSTDKGFGPVFDHMLLSVHLDNMLYMADVGFGDSFIRPLFLGHLDELFVAENRVSGDSLIQQAVSQQGVNYKVVDTAQGLVLMQQKAKQAWQAQFLFSLQGHELSAFNDMCHYHQTSPQSSFTRRSVCSIATTSGRKTISNGRFIETVNGERFESAITEQYQCRELLLRHFQVSLPQKVSSLSWQKLLGESFNSNTEQ